MIDPSSDNAVILTSECATPTGVLGRLHLNNPKALNALTLDGVRIMMRALMAWKDRDDVSAVLVTGEGTRAFCAGGDVKSLQQLGPITELDVDGQPHSDFFKEEYQLNALIAAYPKPYASLLDGVVMGGGVGIAIMGSHRIGTDTMKFGMPETAIGFFPDVGGGYFLSKMGALGLYLALTSAPIGPALAADAGITTNHIKAEDRAAFIATAEAQGLDSALLAFERSSEDVTGALSPAELDLKLLLSRHFDGQNESLIALIDGLEREEGALKPLAEKTLALMGKRSPMAMCVTFEQIKRCAKLSFNDGLALEYALSQRFMQESDFFEGVRSVLVDKDHAPSWMHANVGDVSQGFVDGYFTPLAGGNPSF